MKKFSEKYVIGLTGNIATGKSVVRKMLERLGAYGIDADELGHRAMAKDAPGYQQIIDTFSTTILKEDGNIDRNALGRIVFTDAYALKQLETIVHPLVRHAIEMLAQHIPHSIIVIEAIKLIEGELFTLCDSIWVVNASQETRLSRLMLKRNLSAADANLRLHSQPPQEQKIAVADVIIQNEGSFSDVWQQVTTAWKKINPKYKDSPARITLILSLNG